MKQRFLLLGLGILFLAILLRFPFLGTFPPSMVQDEVGLGYTAISIAETGKDEWGISYPLVFKSFGDYKPPAFFYATVLLYKIIGWEFALPRVTSAIAGIVIVLCGMLWFRKLFSSDTISLLGGLILAVSPWTVHLSRMALESNLGLAFFIAGLLGMSYAKKSIFALISSGLFFALSTYSYHGFRFTVILFFLALIFTTVLVHYKNIRSVLPKIKVYGLILLVSTTLSLPGFFSTGVGNRLDQTLTITSGEALLFYDDLANDCYITLSELNPGLTTLCRLQYNKVTKPVLLAISSFIQHLSPDFLFFSGDTAAGRNPTNSGQFAVFLFPLWMIGIFVLFREGKKNLELSVGYLVALLPSTLSGNPHSIRLSILIPFAVGVILHGFVFLSKHYKQPKYLTSLLVVALLVFTGLFTVRYATDTFATHESSSTYLSHAKRISLLSYEYIQKGYIVYADHDLFPEPHIYYAYWNRIDPAITQRSLGEVYTESEGFARPKQFGETMFFEAGNIRALTCDSAYTTPTIFISNDPPEKIEPIHSIKENTNTHTFAFVYDMETIRSNKLEYLTLCN